MLPCLLSTGRSWEGIMKKWIIIMATLTTTFLSASQVIILLGPPGAGKGTHSVPLSSSLKLPHISTGDLFRSHLKDKTELGLKAKKYIDEGELVPDELVLDILQERISKPDCKEGYILDGFPRTYSQAKSLEKRLNKQDSLKVIYLSAPDSILVDRITGRLSCQSCGAVFHKTFSPPKNASECDYCQGKLLQRKDDTEEVVKKRLVVYHAETRPLIEYYKSKGSLIEVDVNQRDKAEIFNEIKSNFDEKVITYSR